MQGLGRFRDFVREITTLVEGGLVESELLARARPCMNELMAKDNWLPDRYAEASLDRYQQYLLYCDPFERFSVVSFVWGPGQETPIHNHTVWGLLGVLRGSEVSQRYVPGAGGMHASGPLEILDSGGTDVVSPTIVDIHKVRNGSKSAAAVSIHLYGGNIGAINRQAFSLEGAVKTFRSGYSLDTMPNIWSV
jgi:predicted metal-dependent enzyme (double-stranded beta helix superfamily)